MRSSTKKSCSSDEIEQQCGEEIENVKKDYRYSSFETRQRTTTGTDDTKGPKSILDVQKD